MKKIKSHTCWNSMTNGIVWKPVDSTDWTKTVCSNVIYMIKYAAKYPDYSSSPLDEIFQWFSLFFIHPCLRMLIIQHSFEFKGDKQGVASRSTFLGSWGNQAQCYDLETNAKHSKDSLEDLIR